MAGKKVFGTSHVPCRPRCAPATWSTCPARCRCARRDVVDGGIEPQTRQVLENVKAALALAGATMDDVVKTTVWIEDARDFGGMNKVYASYFPKEPPARTTVESRLMIDIKVEIEAVAYAPREIERANFHIDQRG